MMPQAGKWCKGEVLTHCGIISTAVLEGGEGNHSVHVKQCQIVEPI